MIYCFDIDGTICTQESDYSKAKPYEERIAKVNELYDQGHIILLHTARGSTTGLGLKWFAITGKQLVEWGVKYHRLFIGKIEADVFIDDKGVNADVFFEGQGSNSDWFGRGDRWSHTKRL